MGKIQFEVVLALELAKVDGITVWYSLKIVALKKHHLFLDFYEKINIFKISMISWNLKKNNNFWKIEKFRILCKNSVATELRFSEVCVHLKHVYTTYFGTANEKIQFEVVLALELAKELPCDTP